MPDLTITCADCGNEFLWSQDEQQFYREKGLTTPRFCPICRAKHKARELQFSKYRKN